VTKGDLTRSIQVAASGEVADLKDNINTMIYNLRETTETNKEQDWLKSNLAKFTGMLQGTARSVRGRPAAALRSRAAGAGATGCDLPDGQFLRFTRPASPGGVRATSDQPDRIGLGVGLVGQCAVEKKRILLNDLPPTTPASNRALENRSRRTFWYCRCYSKAKPKR
jgi:hypothetical protein